MDLVSHAMTILKNSLHQGILEDAESDNSILLLIHNILDFALININQVYFANFNKREHQSQSLRNHLSSFDFALEIEQMRNELNEWFSNSLIQNDFSPLADSEFGLWVKHKLPIVLSDENGYLKIETLMSHISAEVHPSISQDKGSLPNLIHLIKDLSWHLSEHSKRLISCSEKKDPLTKLFNRRFLDTILLQETNRVAKVKVNYSVVMLDIDYFKKINDSYGHITGDQVLSKIGELIDHSMRASDFAFRFGGEEFLLLLTECSSRKALEIVQHLMSKLQASSFKPPTQGEFTVTLSAGIAEFDGQPDYQHTLKKADQALYQAKDRGRNQAVIWQG